MSGGKRTGLTISNSTAEFLIFTRQAGEPGIHVRHEDETIWLTQKLVAELFGVTVPTVNEHLKNIFDSGELDEPAVVRIFRTTAADGKNYQTQHYNLDAIISVGYRVNSVRATQFRQWATQVLREFATKGFVLDRKRRENGAFLGEDRPGNEEMNLDAFPQSSEREVLTHAAERSADLAEKLALQCYESFDIVRREAEVGENDEADIAHLVEMEKAGKQGRNTGSEGA